MAGELALKLIFERNAYYRRQYFLALGVFALAMLVITVLVFVLVFLKRNPTSPVYFATDSVGELIHIQPTTQPNMSTEEVTRWAVNAVQQSYAYDYLNYRSQLQSVQKYFTNYGWQNYVNALKASNNLVAVKERRWIVLARVIDQPKIVNQGMLGGAYAWKFEMPLLVTNWGPPYDEQSKFSNPLMVTVIVQRQPILQSTDGLGVVQMLGKLAINPISQPSALSNVPTQ